VWRPAWRVWRAFARLAVGVVLAAGVAALMADRAIEQRLAALAAEPLPAVRPIEVAGLFDDPRLTEVRISVGWSRTPYMTSVDEVRTDTRLWRRMRFGDWDTVPATLRDQALAAMFSRFSPVLSDPDRWDRMTADDWDRIPQPIRALAFIHMIQYWSGAYQVGAAFDLPRRAVASTMAAIMMTESWFEHRAVHVNQWGNRDLGLAQASDRVRDTIRRLASRHRIDVSFSDDDYFDPWKATRFLAIWFGRLTDEAAGDMDLAVRAYHRGMPAARRGLGADYLARVRELRGQFIRNQDAPPSWTFLWFRDRDRIATEWPWLGERPGVRYPFVPPWDRQRLAAAGR
jgi:hypothetical protein